MCLSRDRRVGAVGTEGDHAAAFRMAIIGSACGEAIPVIAASKASHAKKD
jgi:hypothetical protein